MSKHDALQSIVALARDNGLSLAEIEQAILGTQQVSVKAKSGNLAMRIFSIMGGIFIFSGITSYVGMFWNDMGSAMRVLITLGSGFAIFIVGVGFFRQSRYPQMVAPIMLVAALLETSGLFVLIAEYFRNNSNNWRLASLIVFGIMLCQQSLTFLSLRIPILLFTSLWFGASFFAIAFDMLGVLPEWNAVIIGFSLLVIAYEMSKTAYQRTLQLIYLFGGASFFLGMQMIFYKLGIPNLGQAIIGTSILCIAYGVQKKISPSILSLSYLVGSLCFLYGWFDAVKGSLLEPLYISATFLMVYFSIIVQSTLLLIISVVAMLSYIGYFTAQHFANSVGWPLVLIILGGLFFVISTGAVRLKKKYMK